MYNLEIRESVDAIFRKLSKKDRPLYEQAMKKISEIISTADVEHYKNLRYSMKELKRVHVGHFVLVFEYAKPEDKIVFVDFDHHDGIYGR